MFGKIKNALLRAKNSYFRILYSHGIHPTVRLYGRGIIFRGRNITIGANTTVNHYVIINAVHSSVSIGKNCRISDAVKIVAVGLTDDKKHLAKAVVIGDNVWLGTGCILLPGVHVGTNSIVGAGAVVTRDVPPNTVVAGVPARTLRALTSDTPNS